MLGAFDEKVEIGDASGILDLELGLIMSEKPSLSVLAVDFRGSRGSSTDGVLILVYRDIGAFLLELRGPAHVENGEVVVGVV